MNETGVITPEHLIVAGATLFVVLFVVLLHYESLNYLYRRLPYWSRNPRPRILLLILSMFSVHVLEIWLFACAYWLLAGNAALGGFTGDLPNALFDYVYFSAVTYTTLGFGDIVATGHLRFMVGTEALTGLMLITWTASFTFLEMQRFWKNS